MHRALASTLFALIIIGCGFATEPDPGHGDLDGGALADASAGGAGGGGGEGGMGGAGGAGGGPFLDAMIPGDPDLGVEPDANLDAALADGGGEPPDMEMPVPTDMGCPGDAGDAGCAPCDCAPCDCGDGAVCDCVDLGLSCLDVCVDLGPLCDAPECVDLGAE